MISTEGSVSLFHHHVHAMSSLALITTTQRANLTSSWHESRNWGRMDARRAAIPSCRLDPSAARPGKANVHAHKTFLPQNQRSGRGCQFIGNPICHGDG